MPSRSEFSNWFCLPFCSKTKRYDAVLMGNGFTINEQDYKSQADENNEEARKNEPLTDSDEQYVVTPDYVVPPHWHSYRPCLASHSLQYTLHCLGSN